MEIDKVRELVRLMVDNELSSISLRDGNEEITLNRASENGRHPVVTVEPPPPIVAAPPMVASESAPVAPPPAPVEEKFLTITSPMVGTFYASANPELPPFVQIGSRVSPASVVCIIEAMKVFNEIRAEVSGTIERILVGNQQPVEYGQPMFSVRPD